MSYQIRIDYPFFRNEPQSKRVRRVDSKRRQEIRGIIDADLLSVVKEALSAQSLACMEKLKALNLSPIAAYLMNPLNGYGWCRQDMFRAMRRYKTFLFISYLYPELLLVPTQEIDCVWHCHILHTRQYRQDCELLFGYFIDHEPDSNAYSEENWQKLDAAYAQTQTLLALFEHNFETEPDQRSDLAQRIFQLDEKGNLHLYRSACGRPH